MVLMVYWKYFNLVCISTSRRNLKGILCLQGSYLLAASNDFASRIWTVDDNRLRVSLARQRSFFCLVFSVLSNGDMAVLEVGHLQTLLIVPFVERFFIS